MPSCSGVIVTDKRREVAEELATRWSDLKANEIIGDLKARRKRWGISHYTIREDDMDVFAPVVAHLAGK